MSRNSKNSAMWDVNSVHEERESYNRNDSKGGDKYVESSNQFALRQGTDDGEKPSRSLCDVVDMDRHTQWGDNAPDVGENWVTGPLKHTGDSSPRYAPKGDAGTGSPKAAEPTGKYAKKGGRGQRSGS